MIRLSPPTTGFNPRTRESATDALNAKLPQGKSFNPRTRESATAGYSRGNRRTDVSIHALVRVRPHYPGIRLSSGSFNPRTRESATGPYPTRFSSRGVSIHALVRVRLLNVYGLIINSATGVLRQPPMGGTKIPGREKEMIVVKIRTPTDYENRRCPGNFL